MIREAEEDGRADAAASFRLALERERHHRDMFRAALERLRRDAGRAAPPSRRRTGPRAVPAEPIAPGRAPAARGRAPSERRPARASWRPRPERIARLSSIREVVFGAQDGLVSTFAVVAGLAAAGVGPLVVLLGGLVSAVAGVLSMSIGTFLAVARPAPALRDRARSRASRDPRSPGRGGRRADRRPGGARHAARRRVGGGPPHRPPSRAAAAARSPSSSWAWRPQRLGTPGAGRVRHGRGPSAAPR